VKDVAEFLGTSLQLAVPRDILFDPVEKVKVAAEKATKRKYEEVAVDVESSSAASRGRRPLLRGSVNYGGTAFSTLSSGVWSSNVPPKPLMLRCPGALAKGGKSFCLFKGGLRF
jgi:hypothetical protein